MSLYKDLAWSIEDIDHRQNFLQNVLLIILATLSAAHTRILKSSKEFEMKAAEIACRMKIFSVKIEGNGYRSCYYLCHAC
jgi:hypothetical protein